jgi:hypothetical protein
MTSPRSFAVPGLAVLGMKTSPRDGTGRKKLLLMLSILQLLRVASALSEGNGLLAS